MRKNRKHRIFIIFIAAVLVFGPVMSVHADKISDLEKEKQEIEKQKKDAEKKQNSEQEKLDNVTGQIDSIQENADAVAEEIEEMDEALVETIASVEMIQEEIREKEAAIEVTTAEYEAAKEREEEQYAAMKLRIQFLYEKGESTYLQLLLESQSFGEMVNKADYIRQLYDYDRKMLEAYIAAKQETEAIKEQLEDERDELETQEHELEEEQKNLENLLAEKRQAYDNYEVQLARAKQEAAIYKANIKKQTEAIRSLEAASKKKDSEIKAAKKAEEEAKKAQEEALKRQPGGDDSSSSSGGGGGGPKKYAPPSGYTGAKGQQIANYACQFVGNPYVPGGTSLTNGADCSGFVWRVYKDFGYSVPRTSYSLRSAGTGVSYADAKPGDVVCYAGHVGLYIGNGQIVHASTQRTGIKITAATYKEILAVRRIV